MRYCIFLVLLFYNFNSQAQDNSYLDERSGFKQFKLGEKVRMDSVKLRLTDPSKLEFTYEGNCCQDLFNYEIQKIVLAYNPDKEMSNTELVQIFVIFKSLGGIKEHNDQVTDGNIKLPNFEVEFQKLQDLNNKLDLIFGKSKMLTDGKPDSEPLVMGWFGERIYMLLYGYSNTFEGVVPYLEIGYREFRENSLKKEF